MFLFVCFNVFQSVSENLLQELNRFVDVASQQRARLEASQTSALTDVASDWVGSWCKTEVWVCLECLSFCKQEFQTLMTDLAKAREHMKEERENFSREAAEMENALKEAEALLL